MKNRRATHAGTWYSDDPNELSHQLQEWLREAEKHSTSVSGPVRGVIVPHAGYSYSAQTASYAFCHLKDQFIDRVFLFCPSHHFYLRKCALTAMDEYDTPFGSIPIDRAVTEQFEASKLFETMSQQTDEKEHSHEMQLPFLKYLLQRRPFRMIPLLVGSLTKKDRRRYAELLVPYVKDPHTLFVVSSDFCHWGSRFHYTPRMETTIKTKGSSNVPIYQYISMLDHEGMECIQKGNPDDFQAYLQKTGNTICGQHPILLFLEALRSAKEKDKEKEKQTSKESRGPSENESPKTETAESNDVAIDFVHYSQSSQVVSLDDSSVSYAAGVVVVCR